MPIGRSPDVRLRSQYIGAISLLGKLKARLPRGDEAHYGIDCAIREANNYLLVTDSEILFDKSSFGGYAAFPRETVAANHKQRLIAAGAKLKD